MESNDQNAHVVEFLDYYFRLASPQYAVMLQAPWGAGKTWFIKEYLKTLPQEPKPIYVTLNGVSSKAEIEEQFFEQMHPYLAHKATKIGAKVIRGVLKGTLNFDWNGDGKADGNASIGVPDVGIKEFLSKSKDGSIVIFDDIERCELPMHQLLGYINYFVEHDDARVVLLANEDEIVAQERRDADAVQKSEDLQYRRVREKLIGKTFAIRPDLNSALDKFLGELMDQAVKTILTQERALIAELHASSKSNNLRHLRQALLDFERIVLTIEPSTRDSEMLRGILATFLIYSFEIRSGHLQPEQVRGLESWMDLTRPDVLDVVKELQRKYPQLQRLDSVLSGDIWSQIMSSGYIDRAAIAAAINQSKFYAKEVERPDWLRLNDAFEMEDAELVEVVSKVENHLQKQEYRVLGELMHVTGALVSLASIGIDTMSEAQTVDLALTNVEALKTHGLLPLSTAEEKLFGHTGWAGRSFHGENQPEFKRFLKEVTRIKNEAQLASYPTKASELLKHLRAKDVSSFAAPLYWNHDGSGQYAYEPVLAFITPQDFVETITEMNAKQLADISRAIARRYEGNRTELKPEKGWLDQVAILMAPFAKGGKKMSDFYKRILREQIVEASGKIPDQDQ